MGAERGERFDAGGEQTPAPPQEPLLAGVAQVEAGMMEEEKQIEQKEGIAPRAKVLPHPVAGVGEVVVDDVR